MTPIQPDTKDLIDAVEQFARRKFRYRVEVALLIDLAMSDGEKKLLDELTFHAKFVSHAFNILRRSGTLTDETNKLSAEFKNELEKTSKLLHMMVKGASEDSRNQFSARFLSLSHESMDNLLALLHDLSWIKNYSLDHGKK